MTRAEKAEQLRAIAQERILVKDGPYGTAIQAYRLDEAGFHEVIWTEDLLGELAAVWVAKGARSMESAAKVCDDIRRAFAGDGVGASLGMGTPGIDFVVPDDDLSADDVRRSLQPTPAATPRAMRRNPVTTCFSQRPWTGIG